MAFKSKLVLKEIKPFVLFNFAVENGVFALSPLFHWCFRPFLY